MTRVASFILFSALFAFSWVLYGRPSKVVKGWKDATLALLIVIAVGAPLGYVFAAQPLRRPQIPAAEVQGALSMVVRMLSQNAEERTGKGLSLKQQEQLTSQFYADVRALGVYEFTQPAPTQ